MKAKLGDLCIIQSGGTPARKQAEYWERGNIPWVKISDFDYKYVSKTEEFITKDGLNNSSAKVFDRGTILFTIFATVGEVNILSIEAATNQAIAGIKIVDRNVLDIVYLYYYLKSLKSKVERISRGVAQNNINLSILKNYEIEVPCIEVQIKRSKQLNIIDELIYKCDRMTSILNCTVKSRFNELFGDCDLSLNKTSWIKIASVADVVGGSTPKTYVSNYWKGSFPWFTPAEIKSDSFYVKKSERLITKEAVESCSLSLLPAGTVLLTSRAPIGKVAITTEPSYCNQGFKNIICGNKLINVYVYYLLKYNTDYLNLIGRGSTFKEISKKIVENIRIPVPDIGVQKDFSAFIETVDKSKFIVLILRKISSDDMPFFFFFRRRRQHEQFCILKTSSYVRFICSTGN